MMRDYPAIVRLYDILFDGGEDLRALPFDVRRERLEAWFNRVRPSCMDLSPLVPFRSLADLGAIRDDARAVSIEGLMLKRKDSAYVPGRPKGQWWKWKRDPLTIDAVLMYAQRGHGKRSSYYSDYTFGLWREDAAGNEELVPVGKAYFGFTDQELAFLDRWVRNHTTARFGPVREVEKALVLEVAFDAAQLSTRHKSGVALRFPRIARIRTDKPAAEADRLETPDAPRGEQDRADASRRLTAPRSAAALRVEQQEGGDEFRAEHDETKVAGGRDRARVWRASSSHGRDAHAGRRHGA